MRDQVSHPYKTTGTTPCTLAQIKYCNYGCPSQQQKTVANEETVQLRKLDNTVCLTAIKYTPFPYIQPQEKEMFDGLPSCEISSSHCSEYEAQNLLGCTVVFLI
jgi:hypothetical protein